MMKQRTQKTHIYFCMLVYTAVQWKHIFGNFSCVWCGVTDRKLMELFFLERWLTGATYVGFLEHELLGLLRDVLLTAWHECPI
jgi:hypothetical protein